MMPLRIGLVTAILFCTSQVSAQELGAPTSTPPAAAQGPGTVEVPLTQDEVTAYKPSFAKRAAGFFKTFAYRAVQRSRRGIVLGPYLGAAGTKFLDGGDYDFQGTVGLGLIKFKAPILPDTDAMADVIVSAAKEKFWAKVKTGISQGEAFTRAELDEVAKRVWLDIIDELKMKRMDHNLNKPSFALRAKATYTSSAGAWETSMTGSVGVGRFLVTSGTTFVVFPQFGFLIPAEISYPYAFGSGLRTKVGEFYLRYDASLYKRDTRKSRVTLGARFTFDLL